MALTRPTAAQFKTTKVDFTDTIIRINSDETGANTNDIGIIFERGSHTNAAIVWDESDDTFRLISTTETGNNSTANINISSHHNLHIGTLISAGLTYPSSDGTGGQVLSTNGSGTLSFISVTATPGGSDTQIQFNSGGSLAGNANLTFDGTLLTTTNLTIDNINIDANTITTSTGNLSLTSTGGEVTASSLAVSDLTSGRLTYASTSGALVDNANLTFDGSTLTLNGDSTFSSGLFRFSIPAGALGTTTSEVDTLQIYQATGNTDAFQSFHVNGDYAVHFGLDGTTNDLFVGGWSLGANKYKVWHAGNDGTGSGLDADTVDGYNPATASTANTIVLRDANANFSANVITATSTSARYADLAENYLADCLYPVGTVLMVGGEQEVTIAVKDSLPVIGTVSENPGYLMNSELCGNYVTPVAYIGRVPCRVIGDVNRGDRLSPSNIPGVAQATSSAGFGQSIGIALENYNDTIEGLIEILVGR
jgi:hypothetical protein